MKLANYKKIEDNELVEKALTGQLSAFDLLMQRHTPRCYNIARKYGLSPEDAADVMQESFIAAFKALERFDPQYQFSTWITNIFVRRLLNFNRGVQRAKKYFFRPAKPEITENARPQMVALSPSHALENQELQHHLEKEIKRLPEKLRVVFILYELEDLKTLEIAESLNIPIGTVNSRLHTARNRLRKRLRHFL